MFLLDTGPLASPSPSQTTPTVSRPSDTPNLSTSEAASTKPHPRSKLCKAFISYVGEEAEELTEDQWTSFQQETFRLLMNYRLERTSASVPLCLCLIS